MADSTFINASSGCGEYISEKYFFGANGAEGYRNETDEFVERSLDRLYIIKGGPGTGKSTFMKQCGENAARAGAKCTYYYCGSDPGSLDGVIIRRDGVSIGITDGTAPHTADCTYPGAVGCIVDLGECWDRDALVAQRNEIVSLSDKKSLLFASAYRYLRGAAALRCDITKMARLATDREKMNAAIGRLVKNIGDKGHSRTRCISGITMRGRITLDTFSDYEQQYRISDTYGCGRLFTESLADSLSREGIDHISLRDPITGDITAVAVPSGRAFFSVCDERDQIRSDNRGEIVINMHRFILKNEAAQCRGRRRFAEKCCESLVDGAVEDLTEAAGYHFGLEKIYVSAMDFAAVTAKCEMVSEEILEMI